MSNNSKQTGSMEYTDAKDAFDKSFDDGEFSYAGELSFEASGFVNDEIIALVLSGKKTAYFSTFSTYVVDNEALPVSGEYYEVVDRAGNVRCVIEINSVQILPFNEVTWRMAELDGMDENLESWRERMREQIEEEGAMVGFSFSPDLKLVFQTFSVIKK